MNYDLDLIRDIYHTGAVSFQDHILTNGVKFPLYINLRCLVGYPQVLKKIAEKIWRNTDVTSINNICGVPYGAIPYASYLSIVKNIPMVLLRKEQKDYAERKMIEGKVIAGDSCVIIDDFITSGQTMLKCMELLRKGGISTSAVSVFIDSQKGGSDKVKNMGISVFSVFTLAEFFEKLMSAVNLTSDNVQRIEQACRIAL